tara:strand:+ start:2613 stop:3212 length:600 start_codon:yes stop_codon:yes gene_type:complete
MGAKQPEFEENPATEVLMAVTESYYVQVIQDEEITSNAASAKTLEDLSMNAHKTSENHLQQQIKNEGQSVVQTVSAENASSEEAYNSNINRAKQHDTEAENHHVIAHSSANKGAEDAAKAQAMQRVSMIQRAVMEENQRSVTAMKEIENRTLAVVEEEMIKAGAVQDSSGTDTAQTGLDMESDLQKLAAGTSPTGPKMA